MLTTRNCGSTPLQHFEGGDGGRVGEDAYLLSATGDDGARTSPDSLNAFRDWPASGDLVKRKLVSC